MPWLEKETAFNAGGLLELRHCTGTQMGSAREPARPAKSTADRLLSVVMPQDLRFSIFHISVILQCFSV